MKISCIEKWSYDLTMCSCCTLPTNIANIMHLVLGILYVLTSIKPLYNYNVKESKVKLKVNARQ